MAGLVTLGVDVRLCGRSGYHVSLEVRTVCYLFLLSVNQQVRSYPRSLQEVLDLFSLRLGESARQLLAERMAHTDISYRCTGISSLLLLLRNTRTFITASKTP
jgi:hypothetical protein